jgi:hypothetical protein
MATISTAYNSIADVNLWLKIKSGDTLMLSDMPSIIPLRWNYFKDTWAFIKGDLLSNIKKDKNPDFFNQQIHDFDLFIEAQRVSSAKINPLSDNKIYYKFFTIFDNIKIDSTGLTNEEVTSVKSEIARVSAFSKNDFVNAKNNIINYRDKVTDTYNLSDASYNTTYERSPAPAQITATIVEENYLLTLQGAIKTIDFILANLFAVDTALDAFALARANANNPEIDIGQYKSGRLVKINYGEDLESLANRYLGDPNKWIDIAIANGLKAPYIDEVGTQISILSNGNGNKINLAATDIDGKFNIDKFYINQPIFLQSSTQMVPDQRIIVNIRQVPIHGEIILELDGESDLVKYQIADNAYVRVYLPNTINSSFYILIPSQDPLPDDRSEEVPWFLAKSAEDEKLAKVDIAIDANGEINFTTNGDLKISYGLDNAIQAIKLKIVTELGSLRYHPTFGLINMLGQTNQDINGVRDMIVESITDQIDADPRYDRIESLDVEYAVNGTLDEGASTIAIFLSVRLAGGDRVIPISFTVNYL